VPLTIGIDARAATEEPAGRGRVVRELLRALAAREEPHRWLLYARERWDEPLDERFTWRRVSAPDPWWHLGTALRANDACDVFLSTNSYLTPAGLIVPSAAIVYDMVAFEPELRPRHESVWIERLTLPMAVRRTAALIAISEATARELIARFPAAQPKVTVTPLAASPVAAGAPDLPAAERAGVLAVGTLEPRKNLPRLVAAYARLPTAVQRSHPLLVTGKVGWEAGETLASLESLGDRCRLLGYVPDADLAALYGRCAVFAYPSLGEGFGLPVLEAMAQGAAVLTSDRSSLPEVGGDAAAYVDPADVDAIAGELAALLGDVGRREAMRERGRRRARKLSWDRTAGGIVAVLEHVAAQCSSRS
jgi:glycosyltransferase involved in cell wall biosynthesis